MLKRWSLILGIWLLALTLGWALRESGAGWRVFDALQRQRSFQVKNNDVALILLDGATVESLSREQSLHFPYPRALYAELLTLGERLQARALIFDLIFSEPSVRGPADDAALAQALAQAPFPVLFPSSADGSVPAPLPAFQTPRVRLGNVNFAPDGDGIYRWLGSRPGQMLSLPEAAHEAITGRVADFSGYVHYPARAALTEVPLYNALLLAAGQADAKTEASLRGKTWIVGYSAAGLHDLKPSPIDAQTPGAWIQAAALSNLLTGFAGVQVPGHLAWLLVLTALVAAYALALRLVAARTPLSLVLWALGLGLLVSGSATWLAWINARWWDPVSILAALFATGLGIVLLKVFVEWRERLRFARLVEHSMSEEMLELVRSGRMEVARFGERRTLTVLFADLAGYTGLSERLGPEALVEVLNEYLDDAVALVFKHGGYVDKFIGDALMAFWNAPLPSSDHASKALLVAADFGGLTRRLEERLAARGITAALETRVGLHSGDAVVGNLGARRRFNYTALGDTVNLASRLEGLGKAYGLHVLLSGECAASLAEPLRADVVFVDEVVVKGRKQPTQLHTWAPTLLSADRARYRAAWEAYAAGDFAHAEADFLALSASFAPAATLAARCQAARLAGGPPPQLREGRWHFDEK